MRIALIFLLLQALLIGCAKDEEEEDLESTELALYESASKSLRAGNHERAVAKLQLLESRFPFGRFAEQAQLEIVFAHYKNGDADSAKAAADRFIELHPNHPNVDYAWYLKGMASFDRDKNFLARLLPMDPSMRDPGAARESFADFTQLVRRFPNSEYAPDAQKKMIYLRNLLAAAEVHVARYYIKRGAFIAAANRGKYVFENFQGAAAVPDSLAVMVEAYTLLNMDELADQALRVLASNYPDHPSLDEDGNFKPGATTKRKRRRWLNILTFGLMGRGA